MCKCYIVHIQNMIVNGLNSVTELSRIILLVIFAIRVKYYCYVLDMRLRQEVLQKRIKVKFLEEDGLICD